MKDREVLSKLHEQDNALDAIYNSVEKTRRYFLWTLIISVVVFVLPLLGLILLVPWMTKMLSSAYGI